MSDSLEKETIISENNENNEQISSQNPVNVQSFTVSEEEWTALKALLDKRYTEIATLLRYNKTKDESIQRLSGEVQKYRDGFAFSALKPFINALISLREDCRKSIRDAEKHEQDLNDEKAKKFIDLQITSFEVMLENIGLERKDNSISINGKPFSGLTEPKELPAQPQAEEQKPDDSSQTLMSAEQIKNTSELIEYLNKSEAAIRLALQDRATLDKTIKDYIELGSRTDAEHYYALIAPLSKQLYKLYDNISSNCQRAGNLSGDNLIKFYFALLNKIIKEIENILIVAGTTVETFENLIDVFDTQKHKIVKTIQTDDEKLDRVIANTYTDCYTYEGKVVYQSKVDVYKFQKLTQGEENHG